jgi:hypothetical protein
LQLKTDELTYDAWELILGYDQGKLISDRAASAVMVLIQNAKSIQI